MDFALSDEQRMLKASVDAFVSRHCPPEKAKQWDEENYFPSELWKSMSELEWFGLPFPEEWGGGGGSALDLVLMAEGLGRASLDIAMAYVGTFVPGLTLYKWGSDEQRNRFRDGFLRGENRIAIAISEPDAGSDAAAMHTSAIERGDEFLLNGQKMWCTGAGIDGALIAMYVRTDSSYGKHDGLSLLMVDPRTPGVEIRRIPTLARHILGTNEVFLDDVVVPKANLVGPLNKGWDVLLSSLELERVVLSGAYVGVAQATLDEALAYAKGREQFGKPIGNFQAIAHALADLQVEIDAARLLSYRAAWRVSQDLPTGREASMAKLKGSETYVAAARLGMQVLAGYGFSTESVMSFRWRESIVAPISGGTSQIQRNAIARSMGLDCR